MSLTSTQVGRTLILTIDRPLVNALGLAAVEALRAHSLRMTEAGRG